MTFRCLAVAAALAAAPATASTQQVWISASAGRTSHRLLPGPRGPDAGVAWRLNEWLAARVGAYHLTDRQTRVGSTCSGLILDPAECVAESIDDRSALAGFTLGLAATVARRGRISLALIPSVSVGRVQSDSRGERTGRRLEGSSAVGGISGGAELSVVPSVRWPLALRVGAHTGVVRPPATGYVADGYSPFMDAIRVRRFEIGVSVWKPAPAAAGAKSAR